MNQVLQNRQFDEVEKKLGLVSLYRANMYQLMSLAVQYPTLELAESILNGKFSSGIIESIEWANSRDGMYNTSLEKMKVVAENQTRQSPRDLLNKMEKEYIRLFLNQGKEVVSLYERDYIDKEKEWIISSIEKAYDGVKPDVLSNDHHFPDHIAAELSFLSYLGKQEGEAWLNGNMTDAKKLKITERTFIVHHIRKWGILFFVNMERSSELEEYRAIASVGKVFMTLEHGN